MKRLAIIIASTAVFVITATAQASGPDTPRSPVAASPIAPPDNTIQSAPSRNYYHKHISGSIWLNWTKQ